MNSKVNTSRSTGRVSTSDGHSLFYRKWDPESDGMATVIIVHGLGEHSGRYVHVGKYFAEAGFRSIAFDLRGHGRSSGRPVFVKNYIELATDLDCIAKNFHADPVFLFGHSFGGQLVLWTVQRFPLKLTGLILSAPWLALAFSPPQWQVFLGQKLNRLAPGFRFPTSIQPEKLSRDRVHLESLEDLDLVHTFVTVRLYFEALNAASEIVSAPVINFPVLIAQGDADEVTSLKVTQDFFARLRAPSKELKIYPNLLHELHNETARAQVLADYLGWMKSIIQTGSPGREEAPNRS
jgi:alpha-beta hydrolase superfamily lysophospholipase